MGVLTAGWLLCRLRVARPRGTPMGVLNRRRGHHSGWLWFRRSATIESELT